MINSLFKIRAFWPLHCEMPFEEIILMFCLGNIEIEVILKLVRL